MIIEAGYRLAILPMEISLGQIIRVLDGPLSPSNRVDVLTRPTCGLRLAMTEVGYSIAKNLDGTALEVGANRVNKIRKSLKSGRFNF